MVRREPISVTVVGGFLGAGKTTLLNHVLQAEHGLKIAVVVNDFGSVNIDESLITSAEGGLYGLSNGCVCCGLNQGLVEQLEELLAMERDFDHIVIEASGVADPGRIMDTVRYSRFAGRLRADAVVVLVDVGNFGAAIAAAPDLAESQLGSADLLVINKTDLVDRAGLDAFRAHWLAPDMRVVETVDARVPFDILFAGQVAAPGVSSGLACEPVHEQATSAVWRSAGRVELSQLQAVLAGLPADVYRAKGIVRDVAGRRFVLHMVGQRLSLTLMPDTKRELADDNVIALIGFGASSAYQPILARLDGCVAAWVPESGAA